TCRPTRYLSKAIDCLGLLHCHGLPLFIGRIGTYRATGVARLLWASRPERLLHGRHCRGVQGGARAQAIEPQLSRGRRIECSHLAYGGCGVRVAEALETERSLLVPPRDLMAHRPEDGVVVDVTVGVAQIASLIQLLGDLSWRRARHVHGLRGLPESRRTECT